MAHRRAKLVCTLGPACDSLEGLKSLIDAGMDVGRLNFSHGTHEEQGARLQRLRQASEEKKKPVAALQDLCGPKIRTGRFPTNFNLPTGVDATLVEGDSSNDERIIPIQYEGLSGDVRIGDKILFDDGRLVLTVKAIEGENVRVFVDQGGGMRNNIGVHLPSKTMRLSALTEKDKEDLLYGLSLGVDFIALSFVRRAEDLKLVREICVAWGQPTPIIAKIETPDAVENL
jgi:pyruvate kinase